MIGLILAGMLAVSPVQQADIEEEIYFDSLEYLACCIQAEAGNQPELGKRLVCDVILNRVGSEDFPDNIYDVINQENQFGVVRNGSIYKADPSDDVYQIVREELEDRLDYKVLYFTAGGFPKMGKHYTKVADHYFCRAKREDEE